MTKYLNNPVVRSTLITFITALALIVTASDFAWTKTALIAALVSAGVDVGRFGVTSR